MSPGIKYGQDSDLVFKTSCDFFNKFVPIADSNK